jgi:hypothetical protein
MARVDDIMKFEDGEMTDDEVIALFQELVNDGSVWSLQGYYGRIATTLIDQGLVTLPKEND